jgi:hypothetical protein
MHFAGAPGFSAKLPAVVSWAFAAVMPRLEERCWSIRDDGSARITLSGELPVRLPAPAPKSAGLAAAGMDCGSFAAAVDPLVGAFVGLSPPEPPRGGSAAPPPGPVAGRQGMLMPWDCDGSEPTEGIRASRSGDGLRFAVAANLSTPCPCPPPAAGRDECSNGLSMASEVLLVWEGAALCARACSSLAS